MDLSFSEVMYIAILLIFVFDIHCQLFKLYLVLLLKKYDEK